MKTKVRFGEEEAFLKIGAKTFYFGVEEADDEGNWCFVYKDGFNEIFRITDLKLFELGKKEPFDPADYLVLGLGVLIEKGVLK